MKGFGRLDGHGQLVATDSELKTLNEAVVETSTGRPLWRVTKRTADGIDETVCPDPENEDRARKSLAAFFRHRDISIGGRVYPFGYESRSMTSSAGTFEQRSEARIRRYERFLREERRFLWWYTFLFAVYAVTTAVMVWGHL